MYAAAIIGSKPTVLQGSALRAAHKRPMLDHARSPRPTLHVVKAAALPPTELLTIAAEAGQVDAPAWVLPAACVWGLILVGLPMDITTLLLHIHTVPLW